MAPGRSRHFLVFFVGSPSLPSFSPHKISLPFKSWILLLKVIIYFHNKFHSCDGQTSPPSRFGSTRHFVVTHRHMFICSFIMTSHRHSAWMHGFYLPSQEAICNKPYIWPFTVLMRITSKLASCRRRHVE